MPQLLIATDIAKPPGVTMWRNGEEPSTPSSPASSSAPTARAKPPSSTAPGPSATVRGPGSGSPSDGGSVSGGIVEDHPERMAMTGAHLAHAVAQVHAVVAPPAPNRARVDRKQHAVALAQQHDGAARLHARPLLGEHELATLEVDAGLGEQDSDLERKDVLAVQV